MTLTLLGTPDHGYGAERCPDCGAPLPERAPGSTHERRCETCWWAWCRAEHAAGRPVPAIALPVLNRPERKKQA